MTDPTTGSTAEDRALDALTAILQSTVSPEMAAAQQLILRRLATSGDLFPSRVPAPLNITQVGGYLNLIANDPVLRAQVLASALGVAGPNPTPGYDPTLPPRYFVSRANDRPPGAAQAATPVTVSVRDDFALPWDAALATLHGLGVNLPVLSASTPLPPIATVASPAAALTSADLLGILGRRLVAVPGAALVDPATDPLAVGQLGGAGDQLVLARQLDATAPDAATVTPAAYALFACTATTCTQATVTDAFVPLDPVLGVAGWTRPSTATAPVTSTDTKGWNVWVNLTGLVAGVSTVGAELSLLYSPGQVAASSVRDYQTWVWDGAAYAAPAGA